MWLPRLRLPDAVACKWLDFISGIGMGVGNDVSGKLRDADWGLQNAVVVLVVFCMVD